MAELSVAVVVPSYTLVGVPGVPTIAALSGAGEIVPMAAVIVYGLPATELPAVAVVLTVVLPLTPLVPNVSPFTNPLIVAVSVGNVAP